MPPRVPIPTELRADVWDDSGGACFHCGEALHPFRNFHVDHVLPVIAGGTNDRKNLVASCKTCNLKLNSKGYPRRVPVVKRERVPYVSMDERIKTWVPPERSPEKRPEGYVDIIELANWLMIHPKRILRWMKQGMPFVNVGTERCPKWRFDWPDVRAWFDAGKPAQRNDPAA